jgi:hypothetical protein
MNLEKNDKVRKGHRLFGEKKKKKKKKTQLFYTSNYPLTRNSIPFITSVKV